jgi:hypothetical protein
MDCWPVAAVAEERPMDWLVVVAVEERPMDCSLAVLVHFVQSLGSPMGWPVAAAVEEHPMDWPVVASVVVAVAHPSYFVVDSNQPQSLADSSYQPAPGPVVANHC